jgi:hypothetical protein
MKVMGTPGSWKTSSTPRRASSAASQGKPSRAAPPSAAGEPLSWYADSAYGTGDLQDAIRQARDAAVIKPKPLAPAVEGGFTLDDFTVNEDDRTGTCPNGVIRRITARRKRHLRSRLPRLPAARPLHHLQDRPRPHPVRT